MNHHNGTFSHAATVDHAAHFGGLDPRYSYQFAQFFDGFKPFIIPIVGLVVGAVMMLMDKFKLVKVAKQAELIGTVGKLVLYFGAQSFMNIYMGWVMRTSVTLEKGTHIINGEEVVVKENLTGCPAGFALTALQQIISFAVFCILMLLQCVVPEKYRFFSHTPKQLVGARMWISVVIFGCVFAMNIALNNMSLGYINIATNLIIRSCLPLTTFLSQMILSALGQYKSTSCKVKEIVLMVCGVCCAVLFTWARIMGSANSKDESKSVMLMVLGVCICLLSLLCGSLNLALAGVLGDMKLNVLDTVAYMAIPASLFLLPCAALIEKPVPGQWGTVFGKETMTDMAILKGVISLPGENAKRAMAWVYLSGFFSFIYNLIQFNIVHTLSPSATAFGGNFNKAALVALTLILPFLRVHELPGQPWIYVIVFAVVGNIAAFSAYSYLQIKAKQEAKEAEAKAASNAPLQGGEEEDESGSGTDEEPSGSDDEGGCCGLQPGV